MKLEWLDCAKNDISYKELTDDEKIKNVLNPEKFEADESWNDKPGPGVSPAKVETMITKWIKYFKIQEEAYANQTLILW